MKDKSPMGPTVISGCGEKLRNPINNGGNILKNLICSSLFLLVVSTFSACEELFETESYETSDGPEDSNANSCSDLPYNGPSQGQAKQWCQYAQFLECNGLMRERAVQCKTISDFDVDCPYCN